MNSCALIFDKSQISAQPFASGSPAATPQSLKAARLTRKSPNVPTLFPVSHLFPACEDVLAIRSRARRMLGTDLSAYVLLIFMAHRLIFLCLSIIRWIIVYAGAQQPDDYGSFEQRQNPVIRSRRLSTRFERARKNTRIFCLRFTRILKLYPDQIFSRLIKAYTQICITEPVALRRSTASIAFEVEQRPAVSR